MHLNFIPPLPHLFYFPRGNLCLVLLGTLVYPFHALEWEEKKHIPLLTISLYICSGTHSLKFITANLKRAVLVIY